MHTFFRLNGVLNNVIINGVRHFFFQCVMKFPRYLKLYTWFLFTRVIGGNNSSWPKFESSSPLKTKKFLSKINLAVDPKTSLQLGPEKELTRKESSGCQHVLCPKTILSPESAILWWTVTSAGGVLLDWLLQPFKRPEHQSQNAPEAKIWGRCIICTPVFSLLWSGLGPPAVCADWAHSGSPRPLQGQSKWTIWPGPFFISVIHLSEY